MHYKNVVVYFKQFVNHTTIPLKVCTRTLVEHLSSRTREYNDVEFAIAQPDQMCTVPLVFASFSEFSIEPDLPEYVWFCVYIDICKYMYTLG